MVGVQQGERLGERARPAKGRFKILRLGLPSALMGDVRQRFTISVNPVRLLTGYLDRHGVDSAALLRRHGLTPDVLDDLEGRISHQTAGELWDDASRMLRDPDLGLSVGSEGPIGLGLPAYVLQAAPTLGAAFRQLTRFYRLVSDLGHPVMTEEGDRARLSVFTIDRGQGLTWQLTETLISKLLQFGREGTGVDWDPIAVRFRQAKPDDVRALLRFFRAPITFDYPVDEIELDRALLALPVRSAEPRLARILDRYGEELLARLPAPNDLTMAVRQIVAISLGQESSLPRLAERFHTSPRTLERRLARAGLSLRHLVDEMRQKMSLRYLLRPELSLGEVAFLLGFESRASFHRAFRRWTGLTPAAFRERATLRS
jgi:AraC-like DNA-binding protein